MKFSTANLQNRHLACAEARFLPRNLFHFYKKLSSRPRHTFFCRFPCVAASFPLLTIEFHLRHTLFPEIPCVAAALDRLTIESHPRHTLFCRFPCVAAALDRRTIVSYSRHTLFPEIPCVAPRSLRFRLFPWRLTPYPSATSCIRVLPISGTHFP